MTLPILDASALASTDPARRHAFAMQFRETFAGTGFAYLDNHGIDLGLFDRVFEQIRRFHELDEATKRAVSLDRNHRGYIARNTSTDRLSTLANVATPNLSESFLIMREDAPDAAPVRRGDYLAGPNQWPIRPADFRDTMEQWVDALTPLSYQLVRAVAESLDADVTVFDDAFLEPTTWLRLLKYPATGDASTNEWGSAPHHDFGFLTLLAQDSVGGLQVQHPDARWLDVEPRPGSFVLNVGEMLHRYSNGVLRATPHRVNTNHTEDRYSCVFFFDPGVNSTVQPIDALVDSSRPQRYPPIRFADYLRNQLESTYTQHAQ